jgi:hypothetical protein
MKLFRIITPESNFTGERAGVQIIAGRGVTADPVAADECKRMGYLVTEILDELPAPVDPPAPGPEPRPEPGPEPAKRARRRAPEIHI